MVPVSSHCIEGKGREGCCRRKLEKMRWLALLSWEKGKWFSEGAVLPLMENNERCFSFLTEETEMISACVR